MSIRIENNIRNLMPEVAIEFLREIIRKDDTVQIIRLVPSKLAFDPIQEIFCENKSGVTRRRVFGFTPVNAKLNVLHDADGTVMRLAA
jgi:hypothetical protein